MQNLTVVAYCIYMPVAIALTLFVANQLFKNSLVYMKDIFNGRMEIAESTNSLFKIGFYLLNIGFALYILDISYPIKDTQATIEVLSLKIGGFSIYLGIMLLFNLFLFFRGKKIAKQRNSNYPNQNIITG